MSQTAAAPAAVEDDPRLAESELEQAVAKEVAHEVEEWIAAAAADATRLGRHY